MRCWSLFRRRPFSYSKHKRHERVQDSELQTVGRLTHGRNGFTRISPSRFFHEQDLEDRPPMKRKLFTAILVMLVCTGAAAAQTPQEKEASRNATREKLRQLLATSGPKKGIGIDFKQSDKQPYNFVAVKRDGL